MSKKEAKRATLRVIMLMPNYDCGVCLARHVVEGRCRISLSEWTIDITIVSFAFIFTNFPFLDFLYLRSKVSNPNSNSPPVFFSLKRIDEAISHIIFFHSIRYRILLTNVNITF